MNVIIWDAGDIIAWGIWGAFVLFGVIWILVHRND